MNSGVQDHDIVGVISRSPWFAGLPSAAHDSLAEAARIRSYRKHSYLFTTGEMTSDIFCVLSGRIRLMITSALGQEFAITDFEPESWLNEAALAIDMPRMIDAQVNESATVLVIPRNAVVNVGAQHPEMYQKLFVDHVTRTRGFYLLMQGMAFYPLKARLAFWLLQLAEDHGQETEHGVLIDSNLSQAELAQLSLGSRQRINKILSQWREQGLIELQSNHYLIHDIAALQAEMELKDHDD
jgi:CRP-like cAMP-binding protein